MSTIEDRLSAALHARAEQVRPEDLRPADPPTSAVPLLRRPTTWLVAAAACAALVATPLALLGDGDGADAPLPPASQSPTPDPAPDGRDVKGADWPLVSEYDGYDVDGDGIDDRIVTRNASGEKVAQEDWRLEVQLTAGGTAAVILSGEGWGVNPAAPAELDGRPGDEIVYYNGMESVEQPEIGVLQYVDGALRDVPLPAEPAITSQNDGQDRLRAWWVRDGVLFSSRTLQGGFVPGTDGPGGSGPREIELWEWSISDGRLTASQQENMCVDLSQADNPFPCGDGPAPLPGTQPEATESITAGESFTADVDADGVEDEIALEGPEGAGWLEDGEATLVVRLAEGRELTAAVPAGWTPDVRTTPMALEAGNGLLLRQEGGDATPMALYLVRDGRLVAADVPRAGIRFGSGFEEDGGPTVRWDTYLTQDGRLWSRSLVMNQETPDDLWSFYEWTVRGSSLVAPDDSDMGCWEC